MLKNLLLVSAMFFGASAFAQIAVTSVSGAANATMSGGVLTLNASGAQVNPSGANGGLLTISATQSVGKQSFNLRMAIYVNGTAVDLNNYSNSVQPGSVSVPWSAICGRAEGATSQSCENVSAGVTGVLYVDENSNGIFGTNDGQIQLNFAIDNPY